MLNKSHIFPFVSIILIVFAMSPSPSHASKIGDKAKIFGSMPAVRDISLSPDGDRIAFLSPGPGKEVDLYTIDLTRDSKPLRITTSNGDPEDLWWCNWVSNERLVCATHGYRKYGTDIFGSSSRIALNWDGSKPKLLGKRGLGNVAEIRFSSGNVVDWLPDRPNEILLARWDEEKVGALNRFGGRRGGYIVEKVNTLTGKASRVEQGNREVVRYITDGHGNVRIKGQRIKLGRTERDSGEIEYFYKDQNGKWLDLGELNYSERTGFNPVTVDPETNRVLGYKTVNGHRALVSIALDGSLNEKILFSTKGYDVSSLIRIGADRRVIGVSYITDKRIGVYFDPDMKKLTTALSKALSGKTIHLADTNRDGTKFLVWAGADTDPGQYFLFDKIAGSLRPVLGVRPHAESMQLATVKSIEYTATDGTQIPAYLTLPPNADEKNLPALVMPHGGPEARDVWGFDWLAQYFAAKGFAVIQPNFRGSSGYGEDWLRENGIKSWQTSIGDVVDAGKYLVSEKIADPEKLSIFGWSYGGYAALQADVVAPGLFKSAVAVAPVTDWQLFKNNARRYRHSRVFSNYVGSGPHLRLGSPAQNIDKINLPVLLFHPDLDLNVEVQHSRMMNQKMKDAKKEVTYVEYKGFEHSLLNSETRADMLQKAYDFLPK